MYFGRLVPTARVSTPGLPRSETGLEVARIGDLQGRWWPVVPSVKGPCIPDEATDGDDRVGEVKVGVDDSGAAFMATSQAIERVVPGICALDVPTPAVNEVVRPCRAVVSRLGVGKLRSAPPPGPNLHGTTWRASLRHEVTGCRRWRLAVMRSSASRRSVAWCRVTTASGRRGRGGRSGQGISQPRQRGWRPDR